MIVMTIDIERYNTVSVFFIVIKTQEKITLDINKKN